jgi:hypothetical protein
VDAAQTQIQPAERFPRDGLAAGREIRDDSNACRLRLSPTDPHLVDDSPLRGLVNSGGDCGRRGNICRVRGISEAIVHGAERVVWPEIRQSQHDEPDR